MNLRNLKIYGFKSFADKVDIKFSPGITAIVGPNGSGKSNISDAIKWVLGEQSIKSLRGAASDDVIFAGTSLRNALSFAEVSLSFDNSARFLDIDFDTVKITRKIFRNGENSFYINNSLCRLKDINELLLNTGIGKGGYSVISQGKIDDILSRNNENRRRIFEEASGVSKYRYQVEEARKKLDKTEENLLRVNDIIAEINTQLAPLKKQADDARLFLTVSDKLRKAESFFVMRKINTLRQSIKFNEENTMQLTLDRDAQNENLERLKLLRDKLLSENESLRRDTDKFKKTQREIELDISKFENELILYSQEIQNFREIFEKNSENSEKLNRELEGMMKTRKNIEDKLYQAESELPEIELDLSHANSKIAEYAGESGENRSLISDLQGKIDIRNQSIIKLNVKQSSLAATLQMLGDQHGKLTDEKLALSGEISSLKASYADKSLRFKELSDERQNILKNIDKFQNDFSALALSLKQNRDELRKINEKLSQKISRKSFIENIKLNLELYNKTTRYILKNKDKMNAEVLGSVAQIIDSPPEYIVAAEAALGGAVQNVITKTQEDAKKIILHLKNNNIGRATFLPLDVMKGSVCNVSDIKGCSGFLGTASMLIKAVSPEFQCVLHYLLGRVVFVDNISNAMLISKKYNPNFRMVTLDGEIFSHGGSITGGSRSVNSNILSQDFELSSVSDEISSLQDAALQKNLFISSLVSKSDEAKSKIKIAEENLTSVIISEKNLRFELSVLSNRISSSETEMSKLKAELLSSSEKLGSTSEQIAAADEGIKNHKNALENYEKQLALLKNSREKYSRKYDDYTEKKNKIQIYLSGVKKDCELYRLRLSEVSENIGKITENIRHIKEENASFKLREAENYQLSEQIKAQTEGKAKQLESVNAKLSSLSEDLELCENNIARNSTEQNEVRDLLLSVNNKISKSEALCQKCEFEIEALIGNMWDKYELTLSDIEILASQYVEAHPDELDEKSNFYELKENIKKIGKVNISAIDEFDRLHKRFQFLNSQTQDLNKAKGDLNKIISESLAQMEIVFKNKFEEINTNFTSIFKELFGGGSARLKLEDDKNVLICGIDIEAQPPGKALQNMQLMSGGEKALTAIAVLMAVMKLNPTSFCILDEIDAALDDHNVYRYMQYLKNFTGETQFILITHKRPTMELSDMLYGVTMQEKGVSKIISLELKEE